MYCEKCGKYSGKYSLCKECFYEKQANEYLEEFDEEDEDVEIVYYPGNCLICGEEKDDPDYIFCSECYKQYRNKELLVSIIKAKEIKVHEARYYNKYRCADGHYVKSKAEREIDNYLDKKHIRHYYEPELSIDGDPEHSIHPDFYLPDENIYIEHWGKNDDARYSESMKYKIDIYAKAKVTLICTYEDTDSDDIESALNRKLKFYKKNKINYLKDIRDQGNLPF